MTIRGARRGSMGWRCVALFLGVAGCYGPPPAPYVFDAGPTPSDNGEGPLLPLMAGARWIYDAPDYGVSRSMQTVLPLEELESCEIGKSVFRVETESDGISAGFVVTEWLSVSADGPISLEREERLDTVWYYP